MAEQQPTAGAQLPPSYSPAPLPSEAPPPLPDADEKADEKKADEKPAPVQVDKATFLAARLREVLASEANLRDSVANLQKDNARLRAVLAQNEIDRLDADYDVGEGTILQKRPDGSIWRIPPELLQKQD